MRCFWHPALGIGRQRALHLRWMFSLLGVVVAEDRGAAVVVAGLGGFAYLSQSRLLHLSALWSAQVVMADQRRATKMVGEAPLASSALFLSLVAEGVPKASGLAQVVAPVVVVLTMRPQAVLARH